MEIIGSETRKFTGVHVFGLKELDEEGQFILDF